MYIYIQTCNYTDCIAGGLGCYLFIRVVVFIQAMHHCHHKFIMGSATAGLAVNEFNWPLKAKLALWCTSNTGRLAKSEGG